MNFFCYLYICLIRLIRDPICLCLTIATPSFFALFFWIVYHDSSADITLAVINEDTGIEMQQEILLYSKDLISILSTASRENEPLKISLITVESKKDADSMIRKGTAEGMIFIPSDFSSRCLQGAGAVWQMILLDGSPYSNRVALFSNLCNEQFNVLINKQNPPASLEIAGTNGHRTFSAFDSFVPGMLSFAVIMLIFSVSGVVSREIESGAFTRLRMSRLTSIELIVAQIVVHYCLGVVGILLTLLTIKLTGFSYGGNIFNILLLCSLSIVSTVAIGISTASIARSRHKTLLISSVIMFIFILFSGIIFPVPETEIFTIGQNPVSLFDALPTVHLSSGLVAILFREATFTDIAYDLNSLVFMSIVLIVFSIYSMKHFVYTEKI